MADEPVVLEWDFDFGGSFINTTPKHSPGVHVSRSLVFGFASTFVRSANQHPVVDEQVALVKFRDYVDFNTRMHTRTRPTCVRITGL